MTTTIKHTIRRMARKLGILSRNGKHGVRYARGNN